MKKRISKFLSMLLVLSCITTATLSSASATSVEPRYTGLFSVTVSLNISSGGLSAPYGCASLRSGYTADMTLELQRSSNGYSWSSINDWSTSGSGMITLDKAYYVVSGYDYRSKCTTYVYDSNGSLVDSVVKFSATVSY